MYVDIFNLLISMKADSEHSLKSEIELAKITQSIS